MEIDKELVEDAVKYIERMEKLYDGEFGSNRELEEIIEDGDMPKIYFELKELLNKA